MAAKISAPQPQHLHPEPPSAYEQARAAIRDAGRRERDLLHVDVLARQRGWPARWDGEDATTYLARLSRIGR